MEFNFFRKPYAWVVFITNQYKPIQEGNMNLSKNLCLRLSKESARLIEETSKNLGLPTSTYCRMILVTHLKNLRKENQVGVVK